MSALSSAVGFLMEDFERKESISRYWDDPVAWAKDVLGVTLWSKQREIAESVAHNPRTAVRSSNGLGKTEVAAVLILWFLATRAVQAPDETVVVVTAPSFPQIRTNTFAALQRLKAQADPPVPGHITLASNVAEWKSPNGTQWVIGRRPPDNSVITSFQGIHRKYTLVVIDEAGGVPRELIDLAERITTGGEPRILAIGNPDKVGSEFYKMFSDTSDWYQMHVSAFDTPRFTGEDVPEEVKSKLVSPEWVERAKRVWGEDDPRYKISVMGEFPDEDDSVFFPRSLIDRGIGTEIPEDADNPVVLGVDLARMGKDSSVVYKYQGGNLRRVARWNKADAVESADHIHEYATRLGAQRVNIDAGGIGGPIIDILKKNHPDRTYAILELDGSKPSHDTRRWRNLRAEWYDNMRGLLLSGGLDLDIEDEDLLRDMEDINHDLDSNALLIESKKDIRARTGHSPDNLDAAVYACVRPWEDQTPPKKVFTSPESILQELPPYLRMMTVRW